MAFDYDPDELYEETDRETIERWLDTVEDNIQVGPTRGGARFSDREQEFVASAREQFDGRPNSTKPLSGKQLAWLRTLYDRA